MSRAFFACVTALPLALAALAGHPATAQDSEQALFVRCGSGARVTCVVDGDTFWYRGSKIRLSDINSPETGQPGCASERALGERATDRLIALLNRGAFTLTASGRDMDRYGRLLRVASRDGQSIGAMLVAEGLAEQWQGRRGNWCAA
jgi:micrococcal nuclease